MNMKEIGIALFVCAVMLFFAGCGKADNANNLAYGSAINAGIADVGQVQLYQGVWADIYE